MTRPISPDTEVTVGPSSADVAGDNDVAIQAAIELASRRGVRRVRILKGTYRLNASVVMRSGMTLIGEGGDTALRKALFAESPIVQDVNWYERRVRVERPELFPVGCRVLLRGTSRTQDTPVAKSAAVVGKEDDVLVLDCDYIGDNFWVVRGGARVTTQFPVIFAEDQQDMAMADMELDGGADEDGWDHSRGSGVSMQNCHRVSFRGLHVHDCKGESLSWQICNDVTVEDCVLRRNFLAGHPGSGSLRMVVRNNRFVDNANGFYYCWGVQDGVFEDNEVARNGTYGISIGFHDSHNVLRDNRVFENRGAGVVFRPGHYPHQSPIDCLIEDTAIENNGPADEPLGVAVEAHSDAITLRGCVIRETRNPLRGVGVRIAETAGAVNLEDNAIEGFETDVLDRRG